jgi:hypothetical protein
LLSTSFSKPPPRQMSPLKRATPLLSGGWLFNLIIMFVFGYRDHYMWLSNEKRFATYFFTYIWHRS